MERKKHEHSGHSSQGTFDPLKAFEEMDLKEGEQMIDAGCGTGYMSMIASRITGLSGKIISLDIHEQAIDILQKRIEFGSFKNMTAMVHDLTEELEIDIGRSDLILFTNVFHGFILNGEVEKVISFIEDNLKEDGRIAIIEIRKEAENTGPPPEERFDAEELTDIMNRYRFEKKRKTILSDSHYLVLFSRR